jgi:hypothetical protein
MIFSSRFEGNEIILTGDHNDNATALIENIDFAFTMMGVSQIISGYTVEQLTVPDMLIKVSPGIAYQNTVTIKNLLYMEDEVTNLTIQAADPTQTRIDTVEIRREITDFESESRQFKDPDTGAISTDTIDTKQEYTVEIKVLEGTPGSSAPSVESGWLKIAEVVVGPAVSTILNANIKNVDGEKEGDTNTDWTTDTTIIYRNGTVSDMKTFMVDLERALGNDSDFTDGLNNTDDGTYLGGSGKAVRDKYGILSSFSAGIAGGSGTTELEKVGKALYDGLYTKSEDGGYAADELVTYKDTSGRSVKTSNGKLSRTTDGYAGTNDNLFPSEDNIGDLTTDFPAGQGGTSGGSLMRQLGYIFRTIGITIPKIIGSGAGKEIFQESYASSLNPSVGQWINIAKRNAAGGAHSVDMTVLFNASTNSFGYGAFRVTGRIVPGSSFIVRFTPLSNEISAVQYTGRCRIISSNDATDRGEYLQMEVLYSITFALHIVGIINHINYGNWEIITPEVWTSGNLPDGSSYATYGQASADWWRFRAGETELWSGNQEIINTGSYTWTSPIFTGFSNQMFDLYKIILTNAGGASYALLIERPFSSSNYVEIVRNITPSGSSYISATLHADTNANDFYVLNNYAITEYARQIIGISL